MQCVTPIYFENPIVPSRIEAIISELEQDRPEDNEVEYFKTPAPNIIEWVTGIEYWNVPTTFQYWGQYQMLRDAFNLRCRICNPSDPESVSCWGKPRSYLESEVLLTWSMEYQDFVCPKCGTTLKEFFEDGMLVPYNEIVAIVGMRGGKSYAGANIGGYMEHMLITMGVEKPGTLQKRLGQEKSEWFEVNFTASTEKQAEKTIYSKYRQMRRNSPWVTRYMEWVKRKEKMQVGVRDPWKYNTPSNEIYDGYLQVRFNKLASDSAGIAGATRIVTFLDEWARLVDTEGSRSAWELYRVLNQGLRTIRSAKSLDLSIPYFMGMMIAITSPLAADDPAMQTYRKAQDGVLPNTYSINKATWDFNPFQPRELFDEEYKRDPVATERDFGANPPTAATPFISDPQRFWQSIDWDRKPIARFSSTYPQDAVGRDYIGAALDFCELNTSDTFYLFGDAGLTFDTFSLVGGHPEWSSVVGGGGIEESGRIPPVIPFDVNENEARMIQKITSDKVRYDREINLLPQMRRGEFLCTVVDFCIRIIPEVGRDVWFDSIINIINGLRTRIKIASICFDHWNSVSTQQQIRSMGIQSYEVRLKAEDFINFRELVNNGRVSMLPPEEDDKLALDDTSRLLIGTPQELMTPQGVSIVEFLKLSRSPDLKKIYNINKGKVRGRDSDDVARCIVGLNHSIQNSIVDDLANTKKKKNVTKLARANQNYMQSSIFRGRRPY